MVCLDTDILISFLRGDEDAERTICELTDKGGRVRTTVINAYELLKGAGAGKNSANLEMVRKMISEVETLGLDEGACEMSAMIFRDLRNHGRVVNELDVLIAGIVAQNRETIVTRDKDFKKVENLSTQEW